MQANIPYTDGMVYNKHVIDPIGVVFLANKGIEIVGIGNVFPPSQITVICRVWRVKPVYYEGTFRQAQKTMHCVFWNTSCYVFSFKLKTQVISLFIL